MNLLRAERDTLDSYIPGLDKYLSEIPLLELEQPGNGALRKFRELGGPALLVPAEYEGKGASLLDAVRIQRAVGSRSPSLAVATTMHHFSVASLVELTRPATGSSGRCSWRSRRTHGCSAPASPRASRVSTS